MLCSVKRKPLNMTLLQVLPEIKSQLTYQNSRLW